MKIKSKILLEGRYDSLTRQIVNDVMYYVKESEGELDEPFTIELPEDGKKYHHEYSGIKFILDLGIQRTDEYIEYNGREIPYYIKTYIAEDNYLVIQISINERYGREYYQEIYYKLNEDIRHEIEHYLQDMALKNKRFKDRQQPLISGTANYDTVYQHHKDPSEVEALVNGFYRKAKIERLPLDVIMHRDLDMDINDGNLTHEEAEDLFDLWIKYARRRLPDAIYSK